jgi:5S rRNA maturation endonuclease (ribonuclease M5)
MQDPEFNLDPIYRRNNGICVDMVPVVNRRSAPALPSPADLKRAERLREVLDDLYEANRLVPIIVEGKKDAVALRKFGLVGEIITFNRGMPIYDFCEDISDRYHRVVLLMDWDPEGNGLQKKLGRGLKGHWEEFSTLRKMLRILCQKDIKDIEGIPKLLDRLEGNGNIWK